MSLEALSTEELDVLLQWNMQQISIQAKIPFVGVSPDARTQMRERTEKRIGVHLMRLERLYEEIERRKK